MTNPSTSPRFLRRLGEAAFRPRIILFVAFFAWILWTVVDLRLVFQARDRLFLWNPQFLAGFTGRPGSLLVWADSLLIQLCHRGWPGVIALALILWVLLVSTVGFMNASSRGETRGTWVIPGLAFTALCTDYYFETPGLLGVCLALLAANGWARMSPNRRGLRRLVLVKASAALYYLAGEASYYCFLACCVVHEIAVQKRWRSGILFLLAGAGVKFGVPAALAWLDLRCWRLHPPYLGDLDEHTRTPMDWRVALFYCYFPLCTVLVAFRQTIGVWMKKLSRMIRKEIEVNEPPAGAADASEQNADASPRGSGWWRGLRWTGETVLVLSLAAAAAFFMQDRDLKAMLEIDYRADHKLWQEVLESASHLRFNTLYVNHDVNLALYHTGRLPDQMFAVPQDYEILVLREQVPSFAMLRKSSDFLLELGRVNEAEHHLLEMLEMWPTGGALKRLALIKMIKHQPASARLFLDVLRDDLVWGRWAEDYRQRLVQDPDLAGDDDIQQTRRVMIVEDDLPRVGMLGPDGAFQVSTPALFFNLLERNRTNRMAFEFLMAAHLLVCDVKSAAEALSLLDHFPGASIPAVYEEAAMIYGLDNIQGAQQIPAGLFIHGRRISEATVSKYRRCDAIVNRCGGINKDSIAAIASELRGSYFQYYFQHRDFSGGAHE